MSKTINLNEPIFAQTELCDMARLEANTVNNWVRLNHVVPAPSTDRRMRGRRFYTLLECVKARIMGSCVERLAMQPAHAAEVAAHALQVIAKELPGEEIATIDVAVFSYLIVSQASGNVTVSTAYRWGKFAQAGADPTFYGMNPENYPAAMPVIFPLEAFAIVPITQLFREVFNAATEILEGDSA